MGIVVLWVSPFFFNKLREKFFPIATFAIGQGKERYELEEKIRWSIIVALVVSVLASLIAVKFT